MLSPPTYRLAGFLHRLISAVLVTLLLSVEFGNAVHTDAGCDTDAARDTACDAVQISAAIDDAGDCCSGDRQDDEAADACHDGCCACCQHTPLRSAALRSLDVGNIPAARFVFSQTQRLIDTDIPAPELPPRA